MGVVVVSIGERSVVSISLDTDRCVVVSVVELPLATDSFVIAAVVVSSVVVGSTVDTPVLLGSVVVVGRTPSVVRSISVVSTYMLAVSVAVYVEDEAGAVVEASTGRCSCR